MRYVDEFRDPARARALAARLAATVTRPWTLMEVCGGQTHAIVRFGVDRLLPPGLTLLHGPGCPVCVTPASVLDEAVALAARPEVTLCTFGDMIRVPGTGSDLAQARARGGDVRIVASPLDALAFARSRPDREVVFLAVGFETTAPAVALAALQARAAGLRNLTFLVSHVLVPPAMAAIAEAPDRRVQGFLAAGHVAAITGVALFEPLARDHGLPIVVTGFEPVDLLRGVLEAVELLESGRAEVRNAYERVVRDDGNPAARALVERVFVVVDQEWRGIGTLPGSGLALAPAFADLDARARFPSPTGDVAPAPNGCRSGDVLQGRLSPLDCPAFGTRCTPDNPLGATMVSSEGACAAYYRYRRSA